MMANLFSVFDPSAMGGVKLNCLSLGSGVVLLPSVKKVLSSRSGKLWKLMSLSLFKEMKVLLPVKSGYMSLIFITLFIFISANNSIGLIPYVFTATSHLAVTLSLSLPLWVSFYIWGWVFNTSHTFAHLVPQGTPYGLMSFMVLIESVSSVIRPGTLAVRLAANMIAGHLLMALLSGTASGLPLGSSSGVILAQTGLIVLEAAVAVIQSYVFMILITLYMSESQ